MTAQPADVRRTLTHAERIFVRISALQTILAVIAMFTGAVALYAALVEADAVRKQQTASVLPDVSISRTYHDRLGESSFMKILAINSGIGPGRVMAMKVTVDDQPVRDWAEMLRAIGSEEIAFGHSQTAGAMVQAGEIRSAFEVKGQSATDTLLKAYPRMRIEICYCSVFDECWTPSNHVTKGPTRVKSCPDYGDAQFQQ